MPKQKTTEEQKQTALSAFIIEQFKKIAWFFVIVFLAVGYFFIIQPERAKLSAKVTNDITRVTQEKHIKEATLNRLKRQLNEFLILQKHESEILERILPPISRKEEAVFSLNALASSLNFYITSLKVEEAVTPETYFGAKLDVPLAVSVVPVSVTIKGQTITYEKIKKILGALHEQYGIFNMRELEFGDEVSGAKTENAGGSEITLTIDLFFIDDNAQAE
ncbi:MAG: hypothetical protein A3C00_00525 [Candidatus Jacksonbacteria bacterium RIFCSPHIGHO2_02_FULL_44_25]|nr:MAG: hypothetical protein A3C00_00525 [Candidatus Jacksonbacteria bacterium RIFCSPHIGHO2_02_FULL_44_25]